MKLQILIIDNDVIANEDLRMFLQNEDYNVDQVYCSEDALIRIKKYWYDLILINEALPTISGYDLYMRIRDVSDAPIVVLCGHSSDMDKIIALGYGIDDYIIKPFNVLEVKARIKAILRRTSVQTKPEASQISIGDLILDARTRVVKVNGDSVCLTKKECQLLQLLMSYPGRMFSSGDLYSTLTDSTLKNSRALESHIHRLRAKIEPDCNNPKYIISKRGIGYYFKGI